jgi:hypothetical protein
MPFRFPVFLVLIGLLVTSLAGNARADAIDGDWCYKDGRSLSIDGAKIVTPGGKAHTGEYDRHLFRFTIPKGEDGAGSHVLMVLWSESEMRVWRGQDKPVLREGAPEIWRRCRLRTS